MSTAPNPIEYFTVVGVGRSGTSLLMTMLDSHPALALPPETQFVYRHVLRRPNATLAETRTALSNEVNFQRLGFDLDEFLAPYERGEQPFSNGDAYRRILTSWADKTGLARIGDKSPKSIECLPTLRRLIPETRVIHIVRDPRDVYLSRTKAKWCSGRSGWLQTLAYRAQYETGRELGRSLFGDRYLEVHYEDLVSTPQIALGRICSQLGVEYDERMLRRDDSASSHVFPEELDWKREVLGPLLSGNTEKWRDELPGSTVRFIEDCCHSSFGPDGYEPANSDGIGQKGVQGLATRRLMASMSRVYKQRLAWLNRRAVRSLPPVPAALSSNATSTVAA